jgi:putative FmdB family regulatory protein
MPFYEYQCKNCSHELEAMQKVSDAPLKKCPHCGKSQLQRLMSAPVFRLKGGGWYETDFKGEQDNKRNLADRPEAEASKDDSAGTDAKTDAKADAKAGDAKAAETKPSEVKASEAGSGEGAKANQKPVEKSAAKPVAKTPPRAAKPAAKRAAPKRASRQLKKPAAKIKRKR